MGADAARSKPPIMTRQEVPTSAWDGRRAARSMPLTRPGSCCSAAGRVERLHQHRDRPPPRRPPQSGTPRFRPERSTAPPHGSAARVRTLSASSVTLPYRNSRGEDSASARARRPNSLCGTHAALTNSPAATRAAFTTTSRRDPRRDHRHSGPRLAPRSPPIRAATCTALTTNPGHDPRRDHRLSRPRLAPCSTRAATRAALTALPCLDLSPCCAQSRRRHAGPQTPPAPQEHCELDTAEPYCLR
jgi:hypothetical protein